MSPTPVTFTTADRARDLHLGGDRRGGRRALRPRPADDRPVRPQHLPHPAGARRPAPRGRPVRGAAVRVPADRLPPARRGGGRPLRRRARPRSWSAPGRTRSSTSWPRRSSRPAARAVVPTPTYAMYRVLTEQRRRDRRRRPAAGRGRRLGARPRRRPRGRRDPARPSSGCAARTTRPPCPSPTARSTPSSPAWPPTPPRPGASHPSSSSTRPMPSSSGPRWSACAPTYPNLVVVRTASKAYALAGLRVGFAVARPEMIARLNPFRPPGSVSTVSVTARHRGAPRSGHPRAPTSTASTRERDAPDRRPPRDRLVGRSVGDELPAGRLRERRARGRRSRRRLLSRGLVPRTFGGGPPAGRPPAADRPRPRRERPARSRPPRDRGDRRDDDAARRPSTIGPREGRRVTVARTTRETDITVTLGLDGVGPRRHRDRHRLLRPPAGLARPPRPVRPRDRTPTATSRSTSTTRSRTSALVLGAAFAEALGDRAGIAASATSSVPMDESLATAVVDVGGRPYAVIDLPFRGERVGGAAAPARRARARGVRPDGRRDAPPRGTGRNDHHLAEAAFKALGRALRVACELDPRRERRRLDQGRRSE